MKLIIAVVALFGSLACATPSDDDWVENNHAGFVEAGLVAQGSPPPQPVAPKKLSLATVTDDVADRWVAIHNKYRCMHGSPNLVWSTAMAANAQAWADRGQFEHSDCYSLQPPLGPAGENLAMGYSDLESAAKGWYDEVSDCSTLPGCQSGNGGAAVGHFTAMVWKGVTEMGCGINSNNRMYVCQYKGGDSLSCDTPNMGGCYTSNVLAASNSEATCASGAGITLSPSAAPTAASPTSSGVSSGSCADGWSGCTGWASLCGQGYTMQGSTQKLDDFCAKTCGQC